MHLTRLSLSTTNKFYSFTYTIYFRMKGAIVAFALFASLASAGVLDERRPMCSNEGGPCDFRLFECCTNQRLYCVRADRSHHVLPEEKLINDLCSRTRSAIVTRERPWRKARWIRQVNMYPS